LSFSDSKTENTPAMLYIEISHESLLEKLHKKDRAMIGRAIAASKQSTLKNPKQMGSALGHVASCNTTRSTVFRRKHISTHTEIATILGLLKQERRHAGSSFIWNTPINLGGKYGIMYIARTMSESQSFGLAAPCQHCMTMLYKFGIRRICFTNQDKNGRSIATFGKIMSSR
jgi:tRNA(Arg) A34 adenosine deaminase TadA